MNIFIKTNEIYGGRDKWHSIGVKLQENDAPGHGFSIEHYVTGISQAGDLSDSHEPAMVWLKC